MLHIKSFTFNPYQENTYLLYNEQKQCAIVDPGMYTPQEQEQLRTFILAHSLQPVHLLNTHCHVDHVLGNKFVYDTYGLCAQFHEGEIPVLMEVQQYAPQMGFHYEAAPIAETFLNQGDTILLGEDSLQALLVPGHSPAHLCFYCAGQHFVIGGDALFRNSIGRTDLPGGNHGQLLRSIREQLYSLPENTTVYPGHGPQTTIGYEKQTNPYLKG